MVCRGVLARVMWTLGYDMVCSVILCDAMLCYVMVWYVELRYDAAWHAMLWCGRLAQCTHCNDVLGYVTCWRAR